MPVDDTAYTKRPSCRLSRASTAAQASAGSSPELFLGVGIAFFMPVR